MDLDAYSVLDYLKRDTVSFSWWSAVGLPALLGLFFLLVGSHCHRSNSHSKMAVLLLIALSVLLSASNLLFGIVASINALVVYLRLRQPLNAV